MRIALLSGADKNAGDFLIVHRSKGLLKRFLPGCEIIDFARNRPLVASVDEINRCDLVVFAGGPGYVSNMYPERFPLVDDLETIRPPFLALGMGGYTPTPDISGDFFSDGSKTLLSRIERDGFGLGCRDRLTESLLRKNGFESAVFTGCPAWYDLEKVDHDALLARPTAEEVRSIAISDPAKIDNIDAVKFLVNGLRRNFPEAAFKLVFHRGWTEDGHSGSSLARRQAKLVEWAALEGIPSVDISYGWEGFHEYDSCDLHVGYRVHAHLHCVSQRKVSFLIEEDGRGFGANDALGRKTHVSIRRNPVAVRKVSTLFGKLGVDLKIRNASHEMAATNMVRYVLSEIAEGYPENEASCRAAHDAFNAMSAQLIAVRKRLGGLS